MRPFFAIIALCACPIAFAKDVGNTALTGTGASEPLIIRMPIPEDPAVRQRLFAALEALRLPESRDAARQTLIEARDGGLVVLTVHGLYHSSPNVRTESVELLSVQGGRRVLKFLIEAFHAAATPAIPPYQVAYVKALTRHISRLTGADYSFYARRSGRAPEIAAAMAVWWQENFDRVPPQLGEPEIEPTDPQYMMHIRRLRELTLERREFGGSSYPAEMVAPAATQTPAQGTMKASVPTVAREQAHPRPRPEILQRDEPGRRRMESYLERTRGAR